MYTCIYFFRHTRFKSTRRQTIHIYTQVYTNAYQYTYADKWLYSPQKYTCTHVKIYTHINTHICIFMPLFVCTSNWNDAKLYIYSHKYMHTRTYLHVCANMYSLSPPVDAPRNYTHTHVYVPTYLYICICICLFSFAPPVDGPRNYTRTTHTHTRTHIYRYMYI